MITKITLENFKGIKDKIEIPIAPLTLLFGGNSSGKSTILHAIAYAREVLERGECDVSRTQLGGDAFDLGGFVEMVHGHDPKRSVKIRFDLDLSKANLSEFCSFDPSLVSQIKTEMSDTARDFFLNPSIGMETLWVQFEVGFESDEDTSPIVKSYEVGFNEEVFATIGIARTKDQEIPSTFPKRVREEETKPYLGELAWLNFHHPILTEPMDGSVDEGENTHDVFDMPFNDGKRSKRPVTSPDNETCYIRENGDMEMRTLKPGFLDELMDEILSPLERFYLNAPVTNVADDEVLEELQSSMWSHVIRPVDDFKPHSIRCFSRACKCVVEGKVEEMWYDHLIGVLKENGEIAVQAILFRDFDEDMFKRYGDMIARMAELSDVRSNRLLFPYQSDALPVWEAPFDYSWQTEPEDDTEEVDAECDTENRKQMLKQTLNLLIYGPGHFLLSCLSGSRYVGPIREILPRDYRRPTNPEPSRWANGLGAWDMLHDPNCDIHDDVSGWLSRKDGEAKGGLDTKYKLESDIYEEFSPPGTKKRKSRRVLLKTENGVSVHPQGVGVGISQVIPIITATLAEDANLCLLEQPELHLHPSQQASVGDLLIYGSKELDKTIIAETHSIHLVLRVLRRIRQTMEGDTDREFHKDDLAIYFIQSENGVTDIRRMSVNDEGELPGRWPDKFFDQEYEERFK